MNKTDSSEAVASATILPDGSAFSVASLPLPADHWLYAPRCTEWDAVRDTSADVPHPILTHAQREAVIAAVRYAIRGATMCGKESDFDPDALVQNAVYALCGPYGFDAPAPQADAAPSDVEIPYVERFRESHGEGGGVYPDEDGDFVRYSDFVEHATRAAIVAGGAQEPIYQVQMIDEAWGDVTGDQFEHLDAECKRIVYAAPLPRVAETVPSEVIAWRDAYQEYVDATAEYNSHLAYVREHCPFGTSVDAQYQAMNEAQRKAFALLKPMHAALLAASPAADSQDPRPCTSCDGSGSYHRADGEYMGECPNCAADSQDERAAKDELLTSAVDLLKRLKRDLMHARRFGVDTLANYRRACSSAEGGVEEWLIENARAASAPSHASAAGAPTQVATTHSTTTIGGAGIMLKQIPVVRDESGFWSHPDLIHFWHVEMNDAEHCTKEQWADLERRAGIKTKIVTLESEPLEHPVYVSYFDNGDPNISAWDPSPPPGWWLIDICDNEDGPFAVWATHADPASSGGDQ